MSGIRGPSATGPEAPGSVPLPAAPERARAWIWSEVVGPLLVSRAVLFLVAWLAQAFVANPGYPVRAAASRGWQFSPHRLLDVWGRWDAGWYLDIVRGGYAASPRYQSEQSTIAFFPLFPVLVRLFVAQLPPGMRNDSTRLLVGFVLSTAALLVGLVALRALVAHVAGADAARRAVLYVLAFPTGFFLSAFYPEALLLATSTGACLAAVKGRWWVAGALGALAALTRPHGVAILLPLAWIHGQSLGWRLRRIGLPALALVLAPIALLAFLWTLRSLTGDLLAPFRAQAAWHRTFSWPWKTIVSPRYFEGTFSRVQQILTVGALGVMAWSLARLPTAAFGAYALAITLPSLLSGTLMGIGRHLAVVFPLFMALGMMGAREGVHRAVLIVLFAIQVFLMAAWARFYPIV
jgi:hypothetical protein